MNNTLKTLLVLGGLLVAVVVGVSFPTVKDVKVPTTDEVVSKVLPLIPKAKDGKDGAQGPRGLKGEPGEATLGAVVGPDQFLPYWNYNGLHLTREEVRWNEASTTICSFLSPAATSTLVRATIQMTEATSTDVQISWGRGTGSEDFATTTLFAKAATTTPQIEFANNATGIDDFQHSVVATSTELAKITGADVALPLDRTVFSPKDRFNVAIALETLDDSNFGISGTCTAIFQEL